nr:hypothetical protein [Tanacetum cinerariifolium]
SFCYDDDDDYGESTIPLNEDISQEPPSNTITPVLPTLELEDSLIMGNEELNTIPEKESEKFIKSSVEDLVPIPRESEDTSGSDSECILPSCDDFFPINVFEEKSVTFSNPIFDSNKDECFTSGDDIELLLHHDPSIPKMSVVSILEGFTDEPPLEENDELFDLESKEIEWNKFCIKDDFYDSEGDVLYLESLLSDDITPNLPPEEFLDRNPRSFNDLKIMVKIFDPGIHEKSFSPTYDCLDFEDSCACGFVHRPLELQSLACLYGNPIS